MSFDTQINTALYFSSVNEIPSKIWQQLNCSDNYYFNPKYLDALEKNNLQIQFGYIVLTDKDNQAIAFAVVQIVDFYLNSVKNNLQSIIESIKCIGRKSRMLSSEKPFKILTCGNVFVSGMHGAFIKKNQDEKKLLREIAKAMLDFVNTNTVLQKEIDGYMFKDFCNEFISITDELLNYSYSSFNVDPNMILHLDKQWKTFDDYLAAMKTKFRVKAKKALKSSADLYVEDVTLDNIDQLLPKMTALYKKVSAKASFNLGDFNLNTYRTLKQNLGDDYILKTYSINTKLVGFLSGMINQQCLDAHYVGIDYAENKQYAIYQRMLYDYIKIALSHKLPTLNFGRTASEIKSSVGAVPQDLTIYLRHKKSIPNRILRLFLKRIAPTPFNQKFPFKATI
ncbi:GNAT family N-acetyltransferase [Tenacibaculum sp. UWU-22]|uniref:GNAT family N-acetyltransferase n=1 Tax=Tenacibaculum sp. UWU-22 TaxID=3234187 RepID=UPI0034DB1425